MTGSPPKVGDKVVYLREAWETAPLLPEWQSRTEIPSIVVVADTSDDGVYVTCWSSDECDTWAASARHLRVVERASYEQVGEVTGERT